MPPKKGKGKEKPPKVDLTKASGPPQKPKPPPPPPACFTQEDLIRFKEVYKAHDEDNIDKVPIKLLPLMLRRLGFNPKGSEVAKLCETFLEDEFVDTIELHEWYFMIEAKMQWGDDFEKKVIDSVAILGHDEEKTDLVNFEVLRQELTAWGEPLTEEEMVDWIRIAIKDKLLNPVDNSFRYEKFVDNMNSRDHRFLNEPINYFKLDQKTLAEMAMKKAAEEREENERKEAEKKAREEAKRLRMIADGLLPPD